MRCNGTELVGGDGDTAERKCPSFRHCSIVELSETQKWTSLTLYAGKNAEKGGKDGINQGDGCQESVNTIESFRNLPALTQDTR